MEFGARLAERLLEPAGLGDAESAAVRAAHRLVVLFVSNFVGGLAAGGGHVLSQVAVAPASSLLPAILGSGEVHAFAPVDGQDLLRSSRPDLPEDLQQQACSEGRREARIKLAQEATSGIRVATDRLVLPVSALAFGVANGVLSAATTGIETSLQARLLLVAGSSSLAGAVTGLAMAGRTVSATTRMVDDWPGPELPLHKGVVRPFPGIARAIASAGVNFNGGRSGWATVSNVLEQGLLRGLSVFGVTLPNLVLAQWAPALTEAAGVRLSTAEWRALNGAVGCATFVVAVMCWFPLLERCMRRQQWQRRPCDAEAPPEPMPSTEAPRVSVDLRDVRRATLNLPYFDRPSSSGHGTAP